MKIPFMHPIRLVAIALLGCAPTGNPPRVWKNPVVLSPFLDAQEVYFEIDPKRRTAYLRGYAPSVLNGSESARHFGKMKGLIQEARFCQEIYNFETIESEGERLGLHGGEGGEIPVFECRVRFADTALDRSLEDFLGHVSRRELRVGLGPDEFGVNYSDAPIALSSHNALSHMFLKNQEGEVVRNAIFWKTDQEKYFGVIGTSDKAYSIRLEADLFRNPVSSPGFPD